MKEIELAGYTVNFTGKLHVIRNVRGGVPGRNSCMLMPMTTPLPIKTLITFQRAGFHDAPRLSMSLSRAQLEQQLD